MDQQEEKDQAEEQTALVDHVLLHVLQALQKEGEIEEFGDEEDDDHHFLDGLHSVVCWYGEQ